MLAWNHRRRHARARAWVVVSAIAVALVACGLDVVGTAPDGTGDGGSTPGDPGQPGTPVAPPGTPPGTLPDGGSVMLPNDGGADATAADAADGSVIKDAAPDGAIVFACPTGNTTDCATCGGGRTLGCVMCASAGSGIYAVCTPPGVSCYTNYRPTGYTWCRCASGNPSQCKLPKQGCNPYDNGVCVTCGENGTQGDPCNGGGSCNESMKKCL